jgi:hypothetical protein
MAAQLEPIRELVAILAIGAPPSRTCRDSGHRGRRLRELVAILAIGAPPFANLSRIWPSGRHLRELVADLVIGPPDDPALDPSVVVDGQRSQHLQATGSPVRSTTAAKTSPSPPVSAASASSAERSTR